MCGPTGAAADRGCSSVRSPSKRFEQRHQFVIVADDMIGAQLLGRPVEEAKADDDARRRRGLCRHDVIDAVADQRRAAAAALLALSQDPGGGGIALAPPPRVPADDPAHAAPEAE